MQGSAVLDVVVALVIIAGAVSGYRLGLLRSAFGLAGVVAGGIAAYFVIPAVVAWIAAPEWRVAGVLGTALGLVIVGYLVGALIGGAMRHGASKAKLGFIDRMLGLLSSGIAAALVIAMIAPGVSSLGVPGLSQAMASSAILRQIDALTPEPVKSWLAQLRTTAIEDGAPWIVDALGAPTSAPSIPSVSADNPGLAAATASVVRITGTAYSCGVTSSGSGFAVAPDRVVTNAHVVAGISDPVVEVSGQLPQTGRVVYFDEQTDLAIIAVVGLRAPAIPLSPSLPAASTAAVAGYPFGGPFSVIGAEVLNAGPLQLVSGNGVTPTDREVYTLAADIEPGNSGGPLLTTDGRVAGVVFAKASSVANVGYALTMAELSPVADEAAGLSAAVGTGGCSH